MFNSQNLRQELKIVNISSLCKTLLCSFLGLIPFFNLILSISRLLELYKLLHNLFFQIFNYGCAYHTVWCFVEVFKIIYSSGY